MLVVVLMHLQGQLLGSPGEGSQWCYRLLVNRLHIFTSTGLSGEVTLHRLKSLALHLPGFLLYLQMTHKERAVHLVAYT